MLQIMIGHLQKHNTIFIAAEHEARKRAWNDGVNGMEIICVDSKQVKNEKPYIVS